MTADGVRRLSNSNEIKIPENSMKEDFVYNEETGHFIETSEYKRIVEHKITEYEIGIKNKKIKKLKE